MVLGRNIAQGFRSAVDDGTVSVLRLQAGRRGENPYYFSTQGCRLAVSWFSSGMLPSEVPFAAAAALRALRSKKLAISRAVHQLERIEWLKGT